METSGIVWCDVYQTGRADGPDERNGKTAQTAGQQRVAVTCQALTIVRLVMPFVMVLDFLNATGPCCSIRQLAVQLDPTTMQLDCDNESLNPSTTLPPQAWAVHIC